MMPAWSEIAHSVAACCRVALESGIALMLRTTLPVSAALIAGWLLRRRDPKSRTGIYSLGLATALAVLALAVVPLGIGRGLITVTLPRPPEQTRQETAVSRRHEFVPAGLAAATKPKRDRVLFRELAPGPPVPPAPARGAASTGVHADSALAATNPNLVHPDAVGRSSPHNFSPVRTRVPTANSAILPLPNSSARAPLPTNSGGRIIGGFEMGASGFASSIYSFIVLTWAIGAISWLIWLLIGQIQLMVLCRQCRACEEPSVLAALEAQSRSLHISCPALLVSSEAIGPFVTGLLRPRIVLGESLLQSLDTQSMRAVLAHEMQHIVSRDVLWTFVSRLLCAVLWPQPLLWALARRWRDASEEACDRAAIGLGCSPAAYARCLVTIAESFNSRSSQTAAGLGMAGSKSALGRRVEKIMNYRTRNASSVSPLAVKITIVALAMSLLIASRIVTAQDASSRSDPKPLGRGASSVAARAVDKPPTAAEDEELSEAERELYRKEIAAAQSELDNALVQRKSKPDVPDEAKLEVDKVRANLAALIRSHSAFNEARAAENRARTLLEKQVRSGGEAERRAAEKDYERAVKLRLGQSADQDSALREFQRALKLQVINGQKRHAIEKYEQALRPPVNEAQQRSAVEEYERAFRSGLDQADKRAAEKAYERARRAQDASQADMRAAEKELNKARTPDLSDRSDPTDPTDKRVADKGAADKRAAEKAQDRARADDDAAQADKRKAGEAQQRARKSEDERRAEKRAAEDMERAYLEQLDRLKQKLTKRQAEMSILSQTYSDVNPKVREQQALIDMARKQIREVQATKDAILSKARREQNLSADAVRAKQTGVAKDRSAAQQDLERQLEQADREVADAQARLNAHSDDLNRAVIAREAEEAEARQTKQLNELELMLLARKSDLATTLQKYQPGHPKARLAQAEVDASQKQVDELRSARNANLREAERAKLEGSDANRKMQADLDSSKARIAAMQADVRQQLKRQAEERSQIAAENRALKAELENLTRRLEALQRQKEASSKSGK
jgi:beta-lactamase regulating signal transducer with metallopeptidase domain